MPTPNEGESQQDFVSRCIPIVLEEGTAEDEEQAAAICNSMYEQKDRTLTVDEVRALCPKCAEIMQKANITEVKLGAFLDSLKKQNDPERICGELWFHGSDDQRSAIGDTEGRTTEEQPPEGWWNACLSKVQESSTEEAQEQRSIRVIARRKSRFGDRVRQLREDMELMVEDVAGMLNVQLESGAITASMVNQIELGEQPPSDELIGAFASIFNVSSASLAELLEPISLEPPPPAGTPEVTAARLGKMKKYCGKALSVDLDKRTVRHWITTIDVDDEGEVLLPKGADLSRFLKTRTVFDGHDYKTRSIIGRNIDYQVTERGILGTTRFTPRPPNHPKEQEWFPDTALWLHHTGDLSGWSVGFDPIENRAPTTKDRMEFGYRDPERLRRVHSKWRMLEYSMAPIPVQEDARDLALAKGLISPRLAGWLAEGKIPSELKHERSRKVVVVIPKPISAEEHIEKAARIAVARRLGQIYE